MRKVFRALSLLMAFLLLALLPAACASKACGDAEWQDVAWKLKSYGDPGSLQAVNGNITLRFDEAKKTLNGSSGCNQYFGDYTVSNCVLKVSNIGATLMACTDGNLMQQEQTYLNLLKDAGKVEIKGGELRVTCGEKLLVFTR